MKILPAIPADAPALADLFLAPIPNTSPTVSSKWEWANPI